MTSSFNGHILWGQLWKHVCPKSGRGPPLSNEGHHEPRRLGIIFKSLPCVRFQDLIRGPLKSAWIRNLQASAQPIWRSTGSGGGFFFHFFSPPALTPYPFILFSFVRSSRSSQRSGSLQWQGEGAPFLSFSFSFFFSFVLLASDLRFLSFHFS